MSREPYLVPSARRVIERADGERVQPMGFIHPCYVEGCNEYAPFGYKLPHRPLGLYACKAHVNGLETLFRQSALAPQEAPDATGNATGDSPAGDDRRP